MIELTDRTTQLINIVFFEPKRVEAIELLKFECADNIPLLDKRTIQNGIERIRFAAIKISDGELDRLYYAVDLAQKRLERFTCICWFW